MIKLIWRTDVHLSDVSPSSRKDDWATTVLGKLSFIGRLASKIQADAVLDGGDFFHVKSPSRNTHDLIRRTADVHKEYPCPVYGNVGNHDCVYGDIEYLDQQPLGVLFSTGVFKRCYDQHEAVFIKDGIKVRVVGIPYHGTTYDMDRFADIKKGDEDFLVCMAHVLASPKGGSMFEGEDIVKYADLTQFAPDIFNFGHWHKDQGVVEIGNGKQVVNIGSLTRGALSQDELSRRPGVAILSFYPDPVTGKPTSKIEVGRIPVVPATEVFDVVARARAETREATMDSFIDAMRRRLVTETGKPLEEIVSGMSSVPEVVRERVLLYIEKAHT